MRCERPPSGHCRVGLEATSSETLAAMEDFLAPPGLSRRRRLQLFEGLHRIGDPGTPQSFDIVLSEEGLPEVPGAFPFRAGDPKRTVRSILRERGDLSLAAGSAASRPSASR